MNTKEILKFRTRVARAMDNRAATGDGVRISVDLYSADELEEMRLDDATGVYLRDDSGAAWARSGDRFHLTAELILESRDSPTAGIICVYNNADNEWTWQSLSGQVTIAPWMVKGIRVPCGDFCEEVGEINRGRLKSVTGELYSEADICVLVRGSKALENGDFRISAGNRSSFKTDTIYTSNVDERDNSLRIQSPEQGFWVPYGWLKFFMPNAAAIKKATKEWEEIEVAGYNPSPVGTRVVIDADAPIDERGFLVTQDFGAFGQGFISDGAKIVGKIGEVVENIEGTHWSKIWLGGQRRTIKVPNRMLRLALADAADAADAAVRVKKKRAERLAPMTEAEREALMALGGMGELLAREGKRVQDLTKWLEI